MPPTRRVSRAAIDLIKRFEGYRRQSARLPDGRWTIGYGHTLTARQGAEVSEADAEALLIYDLIGVAHAVNESLLAPVGQHQFDALCAFAFNVGADAFKRSQVLRRFNAGEPLEAASAMEMWRKSEFEGEAVVVDALVRRRAAERALFLTPDDGRWIPVPSAAVRPLIDDNAASLVPGSPPQPLRTTLDGPEVRVERPSPALFVDETEVAKAIRAAAEKVSDQFAPMLSAPEAPEPASRTLEDAGVVDAQGAPVFQYGADEPDHRRAPPADPLDEPDLSIAPIVPERPRPPVRSQQRSIIGDLAMALLGLLFLALASYMGRTMGADAALPSPWLVMWPAAIAGAGFLGVAVYRLFQRLGGSRV